MKTHLLALALLITLPAPECLVTIHHDPLEKVLSLVCLLDLHDMNTAILGQTGSDPQLGTSGESPATDSLVKNYLLQHLQLSVADSSMQLAYLGHDELEHTMICRLEVKHVDTAEGLTVSSDLFFELNPDQTVVVKVETPVGTESHALYKNAGTFTFGMQDK